MNISKVDFAIGAVVAIVGGYIISLFTETFVRQGIVSTSVHIQSWCGEHKPKEQPNE